MAFVHCPNGHIYDNVKYKECPFCHHSDSSEKVKLPDSDEQDLTEKTMLDSDVGETHPRSEGGERDTLPDATMVMQASDESETGAKKQIVVQQRRIMGFLVTYDLNEYGYFYPLYLGKNKIGRDVKNDIVINDSAISGEHALILFRGNKIIIEDKMSVNGTFLNDGKESIDRELLKDNDIIRIGKTVLKLKVVGEIP